MPSSRNDQTRATCRLHAISETLITSLRSTPSDESPICLLTLVFYKWVFTYQERKEEKHEKALMVMLFQMFDLELS